MKSRYIPEYSGDCLSQCVVVAWPGASSRVTCLGPECLSLGCGATGLKAQCENEEV